jgi:hypothetical protein
VKKLHYCDIYSITDNTYAKQFIRSLINTLKQLNIIDKGVKTSESNAVNVCDNTMERYIEAAIDRCRCIVIVVDSEGRDPDEVRKTIIDEHVKSFTTDLSRIRIVVAHPCLEAWLCRLMGLQSCESGTCRDIIHAIERVIGGKYDKKLLPILTMKWLSKRINPEKPSSNNLPEQLKELLNTIINCSSQSS